MRQYVKISPYIVKTANSIRNYFEYRSSEFYFGGNGCKKKLIHACVGNAQIRIARKTTTGRIPVKGGKNATDIFQKAWQKTDPVLSASIRGNC
jgi:hypothetical protein